jgi:hypothetical protein
VLKTEILQAVGFTHSANALAGSNAYPSTVSVHDALKCILNDVGSTSIPVHVTLFFFYPKSAQRIWTRDQCNKNISHCKVSLCDTGNIIFKGWKGRGGGRLRVEEKSVRLDGKHSGITRYNFCACLRCKSDLFKVYATVLESSKLHGKTLLSDTGKMMTVRT